MNIADLWKTIVTIVMGPAKPNQGDFKHLVPGWEYEYKDVPCKHERLLPGERIPLRYGSAATEICVDCHMWHQVRMPDRWRYYSEYEEALKEDDDEY